MSEGKNFAAAGYDAFQDGLGMLSSGLKREMQKDSIEIAYHATAEGQMDPIGCSRREGQFRALAMRLAQELPNDASTANAILDHTRELARQIREGFARPGLSLTPEESAFIRKSRYLNGLGISRVTLPGNEMGGEAAE